jgi:hypothetical protein
MQGQFKDEFIGRWSCDCQRLSGAPEAEASGVLFDFFAKASLGKWTNAWQVLPFPGEPSDLRGFVRPLSKTEMEGGSIREKVLQTHPHWQPRGVVVGRFTDITIPTQGAEFQAGIGFLKGATNSDGVYFEIRGEFPDYKGNPLRLEYHKPYNESVIDDFKQDLSRFRGLTGTVLLSVDAGDKSAAQDWAAWVRPRLVPYQTEYRFASFVGGAVGSGRTGEQLLNPFGGKSGQLYGNVILYIAFANVEMDCKLQIESYSGTQSRGVTDLGFVKPGQTTVWHTLTRYEQGPWRERIIFNGTYVGDIRYRVAKMGE